MLTKIEISGIVESLSGMHIGGGSSFAAIGAVDSPVMRDIYNDDPMIPGSSLKGKMRSLLSRKYSDALMPVDIKDDPKRVKRLFGTAGDARKGESKSVRPSRLQFMDLFLCNKDKLKAADIPTTEIKFENTINRVSAVANPRQIERSVRGAEYAMSLIYNMVVPEEAVEDFETLKEGMKLLEYDYLGGHGSRGYGRICFKDLEINVVVGECDEQILERCRAIIEGDEA